MDMYIPNTTEIYVMSIFFMYYKLQLSFWVVKVAISLFIAKSRGDDHS